MKAGAASKAAKSKEVVEGAGRAGQCSCFLLHGGSFFGSGTFAWRQAPRRRSASAQLWGQSCCQLLQDACWTPDVERWETDTDSQGSGDEVDFTEGQRLNAEQVLSLSLQLADCVADMVSCALGLSPVHVLT